MSDLVYVSPRCVNLPAGQKSHSGGKCGRGKTWRKGYWRRVKHTQKALKSIESNMKSELKGLSSQRIISKCTDDNIADALNICMEKFIDPVEEHIKRNKDYEVGEFPTPKTLAMIQEKTRMGTECVIRALSHCGGDKDELRILVDDYITNRLSGVPSHISPLQKHVVDQRLERRNEFQEFVRNNRMGKSLSGGDCGVRY